MLKEGVALLNMKSIGDVAVVLDASESAQEYRDAIMKTAIQLFEKLPAGINKKLYFLSNAKEHDFSKLSRYAAKWWKENSSRGSFITPILEHVRNCKVVVVGSGPIYDLQDWQDSAQISNFLFVKVGESLCGELDVGEEIDSTQTGELPSRLYCRIDSVEIGGAGFMPYYWSNSKYELHLGDRSYLKGSNLEDFSTTVAFFGSNVKARIISGTDDEEANLEPWGAEFGEAGEDWKALSDQEVQVFKKAAKGEPFICLVCGKKHEAWTLSCYEDAFILGQPVYPSLGKRKGFILFKEVPKTVLFSFWPVNVIKIGENKVAIAIGSQAKIHEYDARQGKWVEKGKLMPYYSLDGKYLVVT